MIDFGAAFISSRGGPIEYEGRELHLAFVLPVHAGDEIRIVFLRFTRELRQGVRIVTRGRGCKVSVGGRLLDDVVLWSDTAPREVLMTVHGGGKGAEIRIWNVWEDPIRGTMLQALSSGAIEIQPQPDRSVVLRCSDGSGEPEFDDLVILLRHGPREKEDA